MVSLEELRKKLRGGLLGLPEEAPNESPPEEEQPGYTEIPWWSYILAPDEAYRFVVPRGSLVHMSIISEDFLRSHSDAALVRRILKDMELLGPGFEPGGDTWAEVDRLVLAAKAHREEYRA